MVPMKEAEKEKYGKKKGRAAWEAEEWKNFNGLCGIYQSQLCVRSMRAIELGVTRKWLVTLV